VEIQGTKVFEQLWKTQKRINLLRGGARSSKSYSMMQLIYLWLRYGKIGKHYIPKGNFSVVRETMPALRATVLKDFLEYLHLTGFYPYVEHRKSVNEFAYKGRIVSFFSLDDPHKLRGRGHTFCFINEADSVPFDAFNQIILRLDKYIWCDYNPSNSDSWCRELEDKRLPERGDVNLMVSTYHDNPWIPAEMKEEIEGLKFTDRELYEVFSLGNWTKLTGLIFKNFQEVDGLPEEFDKEWFGLDFGFRDPTAAVQVRRVGKALYIKEIIYKRDMLIDAIALELPRGKKIYADSAEPRSIEELRRRGILVKAAKKGQDSVKQGIGRIRQFHLFITSDSINMISEFKKYKWAKDNDGKETNKPIDIYNHCADSLRYALSYSMRSKLQLM